MCDYRRGFDWWIDLLTTYTHDSDLQTITAPLLISTIHKSLQHPLSLLPACCVFFSLSLAMASSSEDSSPSRVHVLSSQPPVTNSSELSNSSQLKSKSKSHCDWRSVSKSWRLWQLRSCFCEWGSSLALHFSWKSLCEEREQEGGVKWPSACVVSWQALHGRLWQKNQGAVRWRISLGRSRCQETASGGCNRLSTLVCVCQWSVKCSSWLCIQVGNKSNIHATPRL
jgi:hypothetical protein